MAVYPECRKKAQAEVDQVIGHSRLPEFGDQASAPYLAAILKETLRWFPVILLDNLLLNSTLSALPHATIADDVYEGYRIQVGSIGIPNSWKILHDSESYAHPYMFRPKRFIPEENGGVAEHDPTIGSFGYGRRICAGKNLVAASVWVSIATTFSAFDWSDPVDESGQTIDHIRAVQPSSSIGSL
ncbi:hypothetical protein M422DRAFT_195492 [Sphaerobolus stellatus SS14]|uniref:Cytochrome P450 n=1 Tax=Sphaerobolus stellatus (strain SS14) TaxID=990650 RepID=A0A0C9UF22_SPHS4|nr:hypothetical protein M422DRAFT_195492 [Sphaerobolus stellatus SS14]